MPNRKDASDDLSSSLQRRRALRHGSTKPEQLIWSAVRHRRLGGLKFRRQHPVGPFIVDFCCVEKAVIVEIDGAYHDYVQAEDIARQNYLESLGYNVIRFTNDEVLSDFVAVIEGLAARLGVEVPP